MADTDSSRRAEDVTRTDQTVVYSPLAGPNQALSAPPSDPPPSGRDVLEIKDYLPRKPVTLEDLISARHLDRQEIDRVARESAENKRDLEKREKNLKQDILDALGYEGKIMVWMRDWIDRLKWIAGSALAIAVISIVISLVWGWSMSSDVDSAKAEVGEVKKTVAAEVVKFAEYKAFVSPTLVAMEEKIQLVDIKADQDVLDKLAKEVAARQGTQDEKLTGLSTDLMAFANKQDELKNQLRSKASAAVVRSLRARVKQLEANQLKPVQSDPVSF